MFAKNFLLFTYAPLLIKWQTRYLIIAVKSYFKFVLLSGILEVEGRIAV